MHRRDFLKAAIPAGAAVALTNAPLAATPETRSPVTSPVIEKVKLAMLSTQRASWEQGVAAQALLEIGDLDAMVLLAKEAVLRQHEDGRLALVASDDAAADPAANGEAVLVAGKITGDPAFQKAADRMLDYLLHRAPRTADGVISHLTTSVQLWSDSMYMAPPFLAVAGRPDEAIRQMEGNRKALWNQKAGMLSHIWDAGKKQWVDEACWGVGNGWAAAGMVRIIQALPPAMSAEKQRLVGYVKEILDGCLAHQRPDGLFHNFVDQPHTFVETNLAQMLAYCIYRGIHAGWLDKEKDEDKDNAKRYLAAADRMRSAAHAKVDRYGLVQDVCGSPDFEHPGTATEGQAFFLLMEAAYRG
ncbi:MAG: glycoside hydrolase family 88 protein [Terriglobales bacterium]